MIGLEDLLLGMVADVPLYAGADHDELGLVLEALDITLPIESRLGADGGLQATAPRGRWRSGFELPHGELTVRFVARQP